jgi:hypothetical protein
MNSDLLKNTSIKNCLILNTLRKDKKCAHKLLLILVFHITSCNITLQLSCRPSNLSVPEDFQNDACEI